MNLPRQCLDPERTAWHITWGTYGTRLHGDKRPTVDRDHNQVGQEFIQPDPHRKQVMEKIMRFPARRFDVEQCAFVEATVPAVCVRGGLNLRVCSAAADHVHVLCDVVPAVHGEKVRRLLQAVARPEVGRALAAGAGANLLGRGGIEHRHSR